MILINTLHIVKLIHTEQQLKDLTKKSNLLHDLKQLIKGFNLLDDPLIHELVASLIKHQGIIDYNLSAYKCLIDVKAISITMKNYPNTIQLGSVTQVHGVNLSTVDLIMLIS